MYDEIVGVSPDNGDLLWSHPHPTDYGLNTSTPVWGEDNLLFVSSGYNGGSRVIKLTRAEGKTKVEEVWAHRLMRVSFHQRDSRGRFRFTAQAATSAPRPFTSINVKTGKVVWRGPELPPSFNRDGRGPIHHTRRRREPRALDRLGGRADGACEIRAAQ